MDQQLHPLGNEKRASWRSTCRKRLSQHIWETVGIKVKPCEVRLKTEKDSPYAWQIDDPSLEPLFQKHLSKHSVGAYTLLHREVGQKYRAVLPEKEKERRMELDIIAKLQMENLNLTEKLKMAEDKASHHEQATMAAEAEIKDQKRIITEAQMTIQLHQQDILNWMALAEWYQTRCSQSSDILGQIVAFLQGRSEGVAI